jgi:hypothetical protein
MATQRKKSTAARRGKTVKRGKAPRRAKAAHRKPAKRGATKAKSPAVPTKAKTRRPAAKIAAPKKAAPRKQQSELPIEVVPGVVVVKEYATVRVRRPKVTAEPETPPESAGIPESNGE